MNPYSMDLRNRVVQAYQRGEGTYEQLARRFEVSHQTVGNWCRRFLSEGNCEPRPHGGRGPRPKLDHKGLDTLQALLAQHPDATLEQRCVLLCQRSGVRIGKSTMHRILAKLKISHKKNSLRHPRR